MRPLQSRCGSVTSGVATLGSTDTGMRILITVGIYPPDIGGPATYVPFIADRLADRGHEVTVVAPRSRGLGSPITHPPYRFVGFDRSHLLRYLNFFIEMRRAFFTILKEARPCDLVYINGLDMVAILVARRLQRPAVVKVVGDGAWEIAFNRGWTTLDLDRFQLTRGVRVGLFRAMRHAAAKNANTVITPSHYLARLVHGWGVPEHRIRTVANAFVAPELAAASLPDPEVPVRFKQGFRLLTVGRLIPIKRVGDVVRVLSEMKDASLVIAGDGPLRQELHALTERLGVTDRIILLGQIPQTKVWSLLTQYADTLILNSVHESFPHILLEAAHFGVPVVATSVGGTPEIVTDKETGLLIPPDSPESLSIALRRLQDDPDLRCRLSSGARRRAEDFSPERMLAETERVLLEAAG